MSSKCNTVPISDALVNTEGGDYLDTGCGQALISDGIKRNLDLASSCSSYQGPMDHGRFSEGIGSRVLSKPPKVDCARVPDTSNIWGLHLGHFGQFTKYLCFQTGFTPPCNRYLLSSIVVSRNLEF